MPQCVVLAVVSTVDVKIEPHWRLGIQLKSSELAYYGFPLDMIVWITKVKEKCVKKKRKKVEREEKRKVQDEKRKEEERRRGEKRDEQEEERREENLILRCKYHQISPDKHQISKSWCRDYVDTGDVANPAFRYSFLLLTQRYSLNKF